MTPPLAIDLCAGLGGWTEGLLLEGWDVIGFDIERHRYGSHQYPAQLVLQDILTLDGRQFRGRASLIVASPPCQRYSYMAMPWTRAKNLITWHRDPAHPERIAELNALFDACLRIGREAGCPIIIENVRGAIPWVGRSRWNYGSFHLWGDVPALMPITLGLGRKVKMAPWRHPSDPRHVPGQGFNTLADQQGRELPDHMKVGELNWRDYGKPGYKGDQMQDKANECVRLETTPLGRKHGSKFSARKAASARIAKIPLPLARHIARTCYPR